MRIAGLGQVSFALGLIGLGIVGLIYGDFALVWQRVPEWVPGREAIAYGCAVLMLAGGLALLVPRSAAAASGVAVLYLLLWLVLLRIPKLFTAPAVVVSWSGVGENGVMLAGAWALHAMLAPGRGQGLSRFGHGASGVRVARIILGLSLIPCGLAHFAYLQDTADLVPKWLPWHTAWAALTGAGFIAAAAGVLLKIFPRLAAAKVTGMMAAFTLLVWAPGVLGAPHDRLQWTALLISWLITAGAWVVADSYSGVSWFAWGATARNAEALT
jgi:uncharacterized membrane protein